MSDATAQNTKTDESSSVNRIEVIDFYGTHRCMTCKAIEASTKYTLDTYFAEEVNNGTIVLRIINVDDEANYDMAEKFEAVGTALFLNVVTTGEEKHIDLTDFAFTNGNEQEDFAKELKTLIEAELKNL
jgi:hypothetical protein